MTPQEMLHTLKVNHNPIGHYTGFEFVHALEAHLASGAARIARLEAAINGMREVFYNLGDSAEMRLVKADAIARAALTDKET